MGPPWESQGSGLGIVGSGRFGDWFILQWPRDLVIGLYCSRWGVW